MIPDRRSRRTGAGTLPCWLLLRAAALLAFAFPAAASAASTIGACTASGGTLGSNLFDNDGTFQSFSSAAATPSWFGPLPAGRTTLKYIDRTLRTSPFVGSPEDGEYTLSNSTAFRTDGAWWITTDHTGSTTGAPSGNSRGVMMVINASVSPDVFYSQTFAVTPNSNYEFGLWMLNMSRNSAASPPNIQLEVDRTSGGVTLPTQVVLTTGNVPVSGSATWRSYGQVINIGSATSMTVRFRNNNPGGSGNDLIIDDLVFTGCVGVSTGSLSGTVYNDVNRDASYAAASDTALSGVTAQLIASSGAVVASAVTDATGYYAFYGVPAASYTVRVQPADPAISAARLMASAPAGGARTGVTISSGGFVIGQDFGYQVPVDVAAVKTQRAGSSGAFVSTPISVAQGAAVQYTVTLRNAGSVAMPGGAALSDSVPVGLGPVTLVGAVVSAGGAVGCTGALSSNALSSGVLTVTASSLPVGSSCAQALQVTPPSAGSFSNIASATVSGGAVESVTSNNSASVALAVLAPPQITFVKTQRDIGVPGAYVLTGPFVSSALSVWPGRVIEYCLSYANGPGVQSAATVTLRDTLSPILVPLTAGYGLDASQRPLGVSVSSVVAGVSSAGTLTSAALDDAGELIGQQLTVRAGRVNSGDSGSACVRGMVP